MIYKAFDLEQGMPTKSAKSTSTRLVETVLLTEALLLLQRKECALPAASMCVTTCKICCWRYLDYCTEPPKQNTKDLLLLTFSATCSP